MGSIGMAIMPEGPTKRVTISFAMSKHDQFWTASRKLRRQYNRLWLADHAARTLLRRETGLTTRRLRIHAELVRLARHLTDGDTSTEDTHNVAPVDRRRAIDRVTNIDPIDFRRHYFAADTPVVIAGAGASWPAANWTHAMLGSRYEQTSVRLLSAAPNEAKGRPGEGRDATYAEIAESMDAGGDLYARFSGIMHQHPELVDDVDVEWFRTMRDDHRSFENWGFFMGGAGTGTGLHSSIAPNLFYEVTGRKRWWIYPAAAAPFFAPPAKCSPYFYSEVDVSDPQKWPIARCVPGWIADLEPGDVLYVPAFAWHQVHNPTATVAVGYRWAKLGLGWRASPIQTLLVLTCSNPSLLKARGHKDLPSLLDAVDY
jgi:hypothetical protein